MAFGRQSTRALDLVPRLGVGRILELADEPDMPDLRYRLDVLAPSVLDAVQSVGGWLFDHAIAGWNVTVLLIDQEDPRPLRILGADVLGPVGGPEPWRRRAPAQILALAGDLLDRNDSRLGQSVSDALQGGVTQVAVWGPHPAPEWDRRLHQASHELSYAAMAFKKHALVTTGESAPVCNAGVETLRFSSAGCSPVPGTCVRSAGVHRYDRTAATWVATSDNEH